MNSESFVRVGPILPAFFFEADEMREVHNINIYMNHHWPASETPFKWRFTGVPMMRDYLILN